MLQVSKVQKDSVWQSLPTEYQNMVISEYHECDAPDDYNAGRKYLLEEMFGKDNLNPPSKETSSEATRNYAKPLFNVGEKINWCGKVRTILAVYPEHPTMYAFEDCQGMLTEEQLVQSRNLERNKAL